MVAEVNDTRQRPVTVPYAMWKAEKDRRVRAEQERDQARQELQRVRDLNKSPWKPAEKLIISEMQRQMASPHAHKDEQGNTRLCYKTAGLNTGLSPDTVKRNIEKISRQWPDMPLVLDTRKEFDQEYQANIDRLYLEPKTDTINLVDEAIKTDITPHQIKQGGNQYQCQNEACQSTNVVIKRTLLCLDCGHESGLEDTHPNGKLNNTSKSVKSNLLLGDESEICPENNGEDAAQPVVVSKPVTPPYTDKLREQEQRETLIQGAAELLYFLAGPEEVHIEMSRHGEKKYYTVSRALTLADALDHLRGGKARGATCRYPDDQARALGWDTDNEEGLQLLEQAARDLAAAGYLPLLEKSPVRGGHLWTIYDALVNASAARQQVYSIAPELAGLGEYWPGPPQAATWNRVRLPGGKYSRPGVNAWCQLVSVATDEKSHDGISAASMLLSHQTPASIVPPLPPIIESDGEQLGQQDPASDNTVLSGASSEIASQVDLRWQAKYSGTSEGKRLWFAWTPQFLANWYNERHSLDEIRPRERNGMALSPNGAERSASTGYYDSAGGERWTDFSSHGTLANGRHDSGDALELQCRIEQAPKSDIMRQAARELLTEARATLESAARAGAHPPAWILEIITDAGREHYAELSGGLSLPAPEPQATASDTGGVTGFFVTSGGKKPASQEEQPLLYPDYPEHACPSCHERAWTYKKLRQGFVCYLCSGEKGIA